LPQRHPIDNDNLLSLKHKRDSKLDLLFEKWEKEMSSSDLFDHPFPKRKEKSSSQEQEFIYDWVGGQQ